MDCSSPRRARRAWVWGLIVAALLASAAIAARRAWPPLPVVLHLQLATVRQGEFRDELVLRARAELLRLVQIDAQESGRVEVAVLVQDGALAEAGQPPLPALQPRAGGPLDAACRRGGAAAGQCRLAAQRLGQQPGAEPARAGPAARAGRRGRRAMAAPARPGGPWLAGSPAGLEQAERCFRPVAQPLAQAREDQQLEQRTRSQSWPRWTARPACARLRLLQASREQWVARAPMAGRLSGFALQPGQSLRPGEHVARIHDSARPAAGYRGR
ncbi:hypothetical protein [Roseateles sp.]|uniref:hypothetical protein n=1 Tax=Roseateles sp. TaxID=1971397 RepID=UPI003949C724